VSSMSGAVFIGEFHPNDGDLIPTHVIQIFEGGSLTFMVTPLRGGSHQRWAMVDPAHALDTLRAAIALVLPPAHSHPLASQEDIDASKLSAPAVHELVQIFDDVRPGIVAALGHGCVISTNELVNLNDSDITILETVYQRTYSHWREETVTFDARREQQ